MRFHLLAISLFDIDWDGMLIPTMGLVELVLRGSIIYLVILFLMRVFRRNQGSLNSADLLVLVMIADAAQNGMSARYNSVSEGVVLVATIFGWNYLLDWLSFRFPAVHRLLEPAPTLLVANGRLHRANMRAEMLTRDDLMEQLREHGVAAVSEVRRCYLEADGHISVIRRDGARSERPAGAAPSGGES